MKRLSECLGCMEYNKVVSKAVATENGLTFELVNEAQISIAKWRIDNCVIDTDSKNKCDYLMVVNKRSACYWIELKDEDIDQACLQIYSTIGGIAEAKEFKIHYARIVLGRFKEDRNRIDNIRYINYRKLINLIGGKERVTFKTKVLVEKLQ